MEHRLTKLESSVDNVSEDMKEVKFKLDEHIKQHQVDQLKIEDRFNRIEKGLLRDKGFLGGVVFVITCLWTFFTFWFK